MADNITKRKFLKTSAKKLIVATQSLSALSLTAFASAPLLSNGALAENFESKRNSPKKLGFNLPDEAQLHERTFMQWPVNKQVHSDVGFLVYLQKTIARIANTISRFEPVVMLAEKSQHLAARKLLGEGVELWDIATDDLWCRDSGPLFLLNEKRQLAASSFNFNGWGNKQTHVQDAEIAKRLTDKLGVHLFDSGLVGEAGGFEYDGLGTIIAHESSWVNANRNKFSRDIIEQRMMDAIGAEKVIWAPGVTDKDITDFHIDSLARFTEPGVVLVQVPDQMDPYDPWSRAAFETLAILQESADMNDTALEVIDISEPLSVRSELDNFVTSYSNYYVCNGAVICAEFGDEETDVVAKHTLEELYPDREVVQLNIDAVGEVGGGIHCATQQQPKSNGVWKV